jgi:PmbA protein
MPSSARSKPHARSRATPPRTKRRGCPIGDRLYKGTPPDLDLFHPWGLEVEEAIEIARRSEAAALAVDKRITNSEGATVSSYDSDFILANSLGFLDGFPNSKASIGCGVVAEEKGGMQRDYWYTTHRNPAKLDPAEAVGRVAGERAIRRLGARKLSTLEAPVIFEANLAGSLIAHFVAAASGSSLYRESSFLIDRLGTQVFAPNVRIRRGPAHARRARERLLRRGGCGDRERTVVDAGVLNGWFLSSYSGRKLGLPTTGNAGGNHNLLMEPGPDDFEALLRRMGKGLLVTDLMGQGVNPVTGRLFAWRGGLLGRGRRDPLPGRGDHHRGKPARHVQGHRGRRKRCPGARLEAHRLDPRRPDDRRGRLRYASPAPMTTT